jgi:hypothetical protein
MLSTVPSASSLLRRFAFEPSPTVTARLLSRLGQPLTIVPVLTINGRCEVMLVVIS